jgi:hypothetical protein
MTETAMQLAYTAEHLTKRTEQSEREPLSLRPAGAEGKVKGLFEENFACKPLDPVVLNFPRKDLRESGMTVTVVMIPFGSVPVISPPGLTKARISGAEPESHLFSP